MKIKKYKLQYDKSDIDFVQSEIKKSLKLGYLTDGGPNVLEFEKLWCDFNNSNHSIAVSNCTTGLECILRALDVKGGSVVVPAYTFIASPMSIYNAGAVPIYADVNQKTLSLSLQSIKSAVREDTKAVMIVHVGGVISHEIELIQKWCQEKDIFLIEDAACAHGSEYNGKKSGNFGIAGCFSFHHSKVLTSGEGGIITTRDKKLAEKMRRIRAIGLDRTINNYESFEIGSNFKMSEITAILAILHVKKAKKLILERNNIASEYDKRINFNSRLKRFILPDNSKSCYYKYYALVDSDVTRNKLKTFCHSNGVELPPYTYEKLCSQQSVSKKMKCINSNLQNSLHLTKHIVCLPMYNNLKKEELNVIIDVVNNFLSE